ncbi:MAG: sugar transferase [Thermoleophilia bacterium]|nr:sugar transferase [Thermoleophilia bacterium]
MSTERATPQDPRDTRKLVHRDHRFLPLFAGPAANARIRRGLSVLVLLTIDLTALFLGLYLALAGKLLLKSETIDSNAIWAAEQTALPLASVALVLTFAKNRLYAPREQRPGAHAVLASVTMATLVMLVLVLVAEWEFNTYYIFFATWFIVSGLVIAMRASYDSITTLLLDRMNFHRDVLLVGPTSATKALAETLLHTSSRRGVPYRVLGHHELTGTHPDGARVDDLLDTPGLDEVVLTGIGAEDAEILRLLDECRRRGIPVRLAPTTVGLLSHSLQAVAAPGLPLFAVNPPMLSGLQFVTKRVFDIVVGGALLVVSLPIFAIAALAIRLGDRGPILYRSERVGVDETVFDCLKLRTMRVDADVLQADVEHLNEADGAIFKMRNDPRVTPVGRLLRRLSIDELPQLINVLRGEMSLVGPRPLPLRDYELLDDVQKKRYMVLPGVTGMWQVSGRSDLGFDELIRLDFSYIDQWSIWMDMVILVKTIPVVFGRKGAF